MKKKYVAPEMETVAFEQDDVLTNSPASVLFAGENEIISQWWIED